MESCKPMLTSMEERLKLEIETGGDILNPTNFKRLVGKLTYLTSIRPDIIYADGIVIKSMDTPTQAAKRILRYIKGLIDEGIFYSSSSKHKLIGYT